MATESDLLVKVNDITEVARDIIKTAAPHIHGGYVINEEQMCTLRFVMTVYGDALRSYYDTCEKEWGENV